jgi:type VI secretion system protein ImpL
VQPFTQGASTAGDKAQVSSAQGAVSGSYGQSVLPACQSATADRYPFVTASKDDAPVIDLLRLFGLNGQLLAYTNQQLRPLLDTTGPVWRWRTDSPVAAGFDPTSAQEFQKAQQISDLISSGLTLKVDPDGFGGQVTAAELSVGGQVNRFDAGQAGERIVQWNLSGLPQAKLTLYSGATKVNEFSFDGPWALFRLMDSARKENAGPLAVRATFGSGAASATLRFILPDLNNPFSRGGPWSFRCPPKL